jgi:hypothetical protein
VPYLRHQLVAALHHPAADGIALLDKLVVGHLALPLAEIGRLSFTERPGLSGLGWEGRDGGKHLVRLPGFERLEL